MEVALRLEPRLSSGVVFSDEHQTHCHRHGEQSKSGVCGGGVLRARARVAPPPTHAPRAGTTLTACGHIITAVIGAGVLSLPYAFANLGWVGGVLSLTVFYSVSLLMSLLLARSAEVEGVRQRRYGDAVRVLLGRRYQVAAIVLQHVNLVLSGIAYTIAAGSSAQ